MGALRDLCADAGLEDARTLLNSGNVVFRSTGRAAEIESRLQREIARCLSVTTEVFLRTAGEWKKMVAANPFPDAAQNDPGHLIVMPLRAKPSTAAVAALRAAIVGREVVEVVGREAFIVYPDGV